MNAYKRTMLLVISIASTIALACGGGGGSASGGIGGSGIQARSVGSVSAVGSITVNNVRFLTNSAAVTDDDGQTIPESSLAKGMVVEVDGQIDADGMNGTAAQVTVITAVQGPVDVSPLNGSSISVMGQPVAIDDQTIIDDSIPNGDITTLAAGNLVEVQGTVDPNGTIRATRVEAKTTVPLFKVRGFIATAPIGTAFSINGLTVDFGSASLSDFGPGGPAQGDYVSVKGNPLTPAPLTLTAASVDNEDRSFGENQFAEIEGFISDDAANPTFMLVTGAGTFQFRIDATTEFDGGEPADLAVGLKVEVDGTFNGGVLVADKVEVKDGIRLETSVDIATRDTANLTIEPSDMSALVLKLNDQTEIDDDRGGPVVNPTPSQLLASLNGSETLRIRARVSNAQVPNVTELVVTELRVLSGLPPVVELRGPLDAPPTVNGDLRILGIDITPSATATFLDIDDITLLDRDEFLNRVTTGTLIKAEGQITIENEMNAVQLAIED